MKTHMEFNFDDPQDIARFKVYENAEAMHAAINDFVLWLEKEIAYGGYCDETKTLFNGIQLAALRRFQHFLEIK